MKTAIAAVVLLAAAPLSIATATDGASTSCSGGIGAVAASCWFECFEGQWLSAYANGFAIAKASCGGGEACSIEPSLCSGDPYVQSDGYGTCEVIGYFWLSYGCQAS